MNLIPLFKSHYSIGRSILTLDEEEEIKENSTVSIFAIAKTHQLEEIYLADSSMSGFVKFYNGCKKYKLSGLFGLELKITDNIEKKDEESLISDYKITIFLKNSDGYSKLLKIFKKAFTEGFYYYPRIDIKTLKSLWNNENLLLLNNFYDGFLHVNLLQNGAAIPDFSGIDTYFSITKHNLPFDFLIENAILGYCKGNKVEEKRILNIHNVYYYKNRDVKPFLVFRAINNRSTFHKPQLEHFSSNLFSFEAWLNR